MSLFKRPVLLIAAVLFAPFFASAQGVASEIHSLQSVLDQLYQDMIPKCSSLIDIGRSLAAFAAMWYIAVRVWRHIASAEPIDFFPLFRPFAIGLAIGLFPSVIAIFNAVLQPTVSGTATLVQDSNQAIATLLQQKEDEIKNSIPYQALVGTSGEGDRDIWMKYYHKDEVGKEGIFGSVGNDIQFALAKASYNIRNAIKQVISEVLQIIYEAAALCINTLRTFQLIMLAIIGPLVLGLSVFDGFQHTLPVYLARYVNIFLWLPICNILDTVLGTIQQNMLKIDLTQIAQTGDTFFSSYDLGYIIFMIIGIVCFTTVPSIAEHIVHVGGGSPLQQKITNMFHSSSTTAASSMVSAAGASLGAASGMAADSFGGLNNMMSGGMANADSGNYFKDNNSYKRDKLSGDA